MHGFWLLLDMQSKKGSKGEHARGRERIRSTVDIRTALYVLTITLTLTLTHTHTKGPRRKGRDKKYGRHTYSPSHSLLLCSYPVSMPSHIHSLLP